MPTTLWGDTAAANRTKGDFRAGTAASLRNKISPYLEAPRSFFAAVGEFLSGRLPEETRVVNRTGDNGT